MKLHWANFLQITTGWAKLWLLTALLIVLPRLPALAAAQPGTDSPSNVLDSLDLGPALRTFSDGQPLDQEEEASIARVLFRLGQLTPTETHQWVSEDVPWRELAEDEQAPEHRGNFIRLQGTVVEITRRDVPERLAKVGQLPHYYEVKLDMEEPAGIATVFTRHVPRVWLFASEQQALSQPGSAVGLLLKQGASPDGKPSLTFAAKRVAWRPNHVTKELGITADHVLLAEQGMDVGLLDEARESNKRPLSSEDTECFYQMLAAASQMDPQQLAQLSEPLTLASLLAMTESRSQGQLSLMGLRNPGAQHGRLKSVQAVARRIVKVYLEDPAVRQRFGFDHYYQIDAFMPLNNVAVEMRQEEADGAGPVFRNKFPITLCVLRLPSGLKEGEDLLERVELRGFFYRLWAYDSQYMSSYGEDRQQLSPLLIGPEPRLLAAPDARSPLLEVIGGVLFLLVLAAASYAVWRYQRGDEQFRKRLRKSP